MTAPQINHICLNKVDNNWQLKEKFLNQALAGRRAASAWFLEIAFVREVGMSACVCACVCVCPPPRL